MRGVTAAVDEMPEDFLIRDFIIANRAEVKTMLLTEYNEEKVMEKERQGFYQSFVTD